VTLEQIVNRNNLIYLGGHRLLQRLRSSKHVYQNVYQVPPFGCINLHMIKPRHWANCYDFLYSLHQSACSIRGSIPVGATTESPYPRAFFVALLSMSTYSHETLL